MMPYHAYQVLQAERPKTADQRRAADQRLGEMAQAVGQVLDHLTRPVRALRRLLRTGAQETQCPSRPAVADPIGRRYV